MNKVAHAIVLGFFGFGCWFLWGILHISGAVPLGGQVLPAYTRLCLSLGQNVLTALVVVATLYCIWVWVRKPDGRTPWVAFLSTTTAILSLMMLLIGVAAYLPLVDALHRLGH